MKNINARVEEKIFNKGEKLKHVKKLRFDLFLKSLCLLSKKCFPLLSEEISLNEIINRILVCRNDDLIVPRHINNDILKNSLKEIDCPSVVQLISTMHEAISPYFKAY